MLKIIPFQNLWPVSLSNEFDFWYGHGIMNTSGLLQSNWRPKGFTLILQETWSIHDSINIPKIEFNTKARIFLLVDLRTLLL